MVSETKKTEKGRILEKTSTGNAAPLGNCVSTYSRNFMVLNEHAYQDARSGAFMLHFACAGQL
jgi:hypothetical protein